MAFPIFSMDAVYEQTSLRTRVAKYVADFTEAWRQCTTTPPDLGPPIPPWEKKKREKRLQDFIREMGGLCGERSRIMDDPAMQERLFFNVRSLLGTAAGISRRQLDVIMSPAFKNSTKEFVRLARRFDANLSDADLFQACRNVWIMNGLQLSLGLKIEFTPAVFAYSLLYPYTDNYLDDATISRAEKNSFNDRFSDRLRGADIKPGNGHENIIFALVEMIEGQFDRRQFPHVFESLLAIQRAQADSLFLIHQDETISSDDVLRISLEKGGTSVLADGYLVAGELSEEQERFLFGYGAYLQFLDDLQDVREDAAVGQKTIYSLSAPLTTLDDLASKTFAFGDKVVEFYQKGRDPASDAYIDLLQKSIRLMLLEAICFAADYFSPAYLKSLERYSPCRFRALRDLKKRQSALYMSMFGKVV